MAATSFPVGQGFASQPLEGASGLVAIGVRHYDPATGRFLQTDPLGLSADQLYAYARNNPYVFADPSGLSPVAGGLSENVEAFLQGVTYGGAVGATGAMACAFAPQVCLIASVALFAADPGAFVELGGDLIQAGGRIVERGGTPDDYFLLGNLVGGAAGGTLGIRASGSRAILGKGVQRAATIGEEAVTRGGPLTSAYRYVGAGEASIIEKTGLVPNVTRLGQPKNVSLTPLEFRSVPLARLRRLSRSAGSILVGRA